MILAHSLVFNHAGQVVVKSRVERDVLVWMDLFVINKQDSVFPIQLALNVILTLKCISHVAACVLLYAIVSQYFAQTFALKVVFARMVTFEMPQENVFQKNNVARKVKNIDVNSENAQWMCASGTVFGAVIP